MHSFQEPLGLPDLQVAGLRLWVHGRQFPTADDYWDGNWLHVTVHCAAPGASVWVSGPLIHLSEIAHFLRGAEAMHTALQGEARLVKKLMRPHTHSIAEARRAVLDSESGLDVFHLPLREARAGHSPCLDDSARDDTSSQLNTHNTKLREVCYPWHPWYGHSVVIHDAFVRHGQAVLRCTLDHKERSRALDIPQ